MATLQPITLVEEKLLGHLRRLSKLSRDFKIEVYGSFKAGHRVVEIRPTAYERYDEELLEKVFEAVD